MFILVLVFGSVLLMGLWINNSEPMFGETNWRLSGNVVDNHTKAIADAVVQISGVGKVTSLSHIFGIAPRHVEMNTRTDKLGRFAMEFNCASVLLSFDKTGYESTNEMIWCPVYPPSSITTNITIRLNRD